MIIQPVDYALVVWFVLAALSTVYVAWDQFRNNPEPRVMKWGFGWELGPFELFDTIGVREVLAAAVEAGGHAARGGTPELIQSVLSAGANRFREGLVPPAARDLQILRAAKEQQRVVTRNAGASLVDLGDGRRLYINRALGHLLRVRFNVRPEITVFRLTRAA